MIQSLTIDGKLTDTASDNIIVPRKSKDFTDHGAPLDTPGATSYFSIDNMLILY